MNAAIVSTMTLFDNGEGAYANRHHEDGSRWAYYSADSAIFCGPAGSGCATSCLESDYEVCLDPCIVWGDENTDACGVSVEMLDGNPLFFPIDDHPDAITPLAEYVEAIIPPPYADGWMSDNTRHNFSFTSELRYWFVYLAGETYSLEFLGDDDVWVFINNRRTVDLGGIHTPVEGGVTFTGEDNPLGLQDGRLYEVVVFQAERQSTSSSYKLSLGGLAASRFRCEPI